MTDNNDKIDHEASVSSNLSALTTNSNTNTNANSSEHEHVTNGNGNGNVRRRLAAPTNNDNSPNRNRNSNRNSNYTNVNIAMTSYRQQLRRIQQDCSGGKPTQHRVHDPLEEGSLTYSQHGSAPEQWFEKHSQNIREAMARRTCSEWIEVLFPIVTWLKVYEWKNNLLTDIIAGLTVGFMIVPQSMSYAKLAGLPVEFGLYSSLGPLYAYAIFGSSRQLAVGPVALVSLLLNTGLTLVLDNAGITPENENYEQIYATMAIQTTFLVGICYVLMGVFRLGFITIFLSHAVVSGFTSAAAIIIGLSQVKYIFGYSIPSEKALHKMLINIFSDIEKFNWRTFVLGTSCVFFLIALKKMAQKYPAKFKWARAAGPLLVTAVTIILQATIDLESKGIPIVGYIPKGLPSFTGKTAVDIDNFGQLAVLVLSIVIVGFMESIAIAKQLATKNNYEIDASKELMGLGVANLMAGLFNGYPLTGSFSRSAVNNDAGAKSGISAIVTATLVGLVLLFLTPVFELLTLPTLAAIVISGVVSLVDYEEAIYLWKVHKFDFGVWLFAFLGTLFLGVELGLGIAVGISLLLVVFESAYPHTAVLGRLPGTTEYRNIKNYPQAERYEGIVVARIDAPIYFANTHNIREKISKYEKMAVQEYARNATTRSSKKGDNADEEAQAQPLVEVNGKEINLNVDKPVKFIILEFSAVAHVDTSGLHTIMDMHKHLSDNKIQLIISNPNMRVMQRFTSSGLADEIGREHIFVSTHDAVDFCLNELDSDEVSRQNTDVYEFFSQNSSRANRLVPTDIHDNGKLSPQESP